MKTRDAMQVLATHRDGAIAVCALGMAANEWWLATGSEDSFYMHGAMGFAASFALGLALAVPSASVWALNADGSLCMNLGCLLTEAAQAPRNLKHFVVDNRVYQTVGAVPMVNQGRADYAAMARAAGIPRTYSVEDAGELAGLMPEIAAQPGPIFTVLKVEAEPNYGSSPRQPFEGPEMKYRFGRALEQRFGLRVFGEQGY